MKMAGLPCRSAVSGLVARIRSLWRGLRRGAEVEAEIREEFEHHVELRTEVLARRGLRPREAARRARIEFGHVEGHREDARAARGLRVFDRIRFSWLDVKLGVRMLAKYPGLSLVSVIGMSVAIAIGGGGFGLVHAVVDAPLPLDEGERLVTLQNADAGSPGSQDMQTVHDFVLWRDQLTSVRDLAAFVDDRRSLFIPGAGVHEIQVVRMTASGFRAARVAPILGRPLLDHDERPGASLVVVIAYEEWQRRFDGDPEVIGRAVRLGDEVHTIVGVMPKDFRFPVNDRYWVPLRLDPAVHEVGEGPSVGVFGRLADGASLDRAQAELTAIGRRMAAAYPETHEHLRPWILPYTHAFVGIDSPSMAWLVRTVQVGLSLLLVVVSVNVAILVYARTAARTGEIAVRSALGASRWRVVAQLFAEALVLAATAAVVGLTLAVFGFDLFQELVTDGDADRLPFWIDLGLSATLAAYVAGLAVLAAAIVGIMPALGATGRAVQTSLQHLSSRGSRMQLGRVWTTLIVVQVAVAVAVLPYALYSGTRLLSSGIAEPDYPVEEFLRASLYAEREAVSVATRDSAAHEAAIATRFARDVSEVLRRLKAEPEVAAVTFTGSYPGSEGFVPMEVESAGLRTWVGVNHVDIDLFTTFDVPILAGRGFVASDAVPGSNRVIVDSAFVEQVPGGGSVLGRRVRHWELTDAASGERSPGPWLEIVGVVPAFTPPPPFEPDVPKLYQPLALAGVTESVQLAVRMRSGAAPARFLGRAREITDSVDPTLRLALQTASEAERLLRKGLLSLALAIVAITGSVLLLSAAGIYAMMSFTVASRRREIGIRVALGAAPGRVLGDIFRRAAAQLGAGALIGLLLAEAIPRVTGGSLFVGGRGALLLLVIAAIMLAIGLLAALGPARRGLAVQPTEALRAD